MTPLRRLRFLAGQTKRHLAASLQSLWHRLRLFVYRAEVIADGHDPLTVQRRVTVCGIPIVRARINRGHIRVALLVDEFFGAWDTAIGGYGALARKYVCKHVPDQAIRIDVLLNIGPDDAVHSHITDGITLYRLPRSRMTRQRWLDDQGYSLFLTIEMTEPSYRIISTFQSTVPILYWIQDPRDLAMYQPRLLSVQRLRDDNWNYINEVARWIRPQVSRGRVSFISQGQSLSAIARRMYALGDEVEIEDLPNPVEMDFSYELDTPPKENRVVFLARLEAQKRAWVFCELAKRMPQFEFVVLGSTGVGRDEAGNARALEAYRNRDGSSRIKNLHFCGHVDGDVKNSHLKRAKLLVNTSIWEGIPVSWLEALSYGTPLVAAFDRDHIVRRFGTFVGEIPGDGTDDESQRKFVDAIVYWMTHDDERDAIARDGIAFVRRRHSIADFQRHMRDSIMKVATCPR